VNWTNCKKVNDQVIVVRPWEDFLKAHRGCLEHGESVPINVAITVSEYIIE